MLLKLILKLSLKAVLPVAAMLGVAAYALYMKGGDPLTLAQKLGNAVSQKSSNLVTGATGDAASSISTSLKNLGSSDNDRTASARKERVYQWVDADGMTHFSNTAPAEDVNAAAIDVDPQRNLMSAPAVSKRPKAAAAESPAGKLPGLGGMAMPNSSAAEILEQIQ